MWKKLYGPAYPTDTNERRKFQREQKRIWKIAADPQWRKDEKKKRAAKAAEAKAAKAAAKKAKETKAKRSAAAKKAAATRKLNVAKKKAEAEAAAE